MPNDAESDVVYLKVGDDLPAAPYLPPKYLFWKHLEEGGQLMVIPSSSPTAEMLKQLLEQMLENERRRLRNEYVRISMLFLLLLAVAIGGGFWFARSLMDQLRAERQTAEQSLHALLQRVAPKTLSPEPSARVPSFAEFISAAELGAPAQRGTTPMTGSTLQMPALNADTNTARAQADIQQLLAGLESKKQALATMLSNQNAQTKNLLQSRDSELQTLHKRMDEMQRKIMNASPSEVPPAIEPPAPPTIEVEATDSLIVTTTNAVTLRLPIPLP